MVDKKFTALMIQEVWEKGHAVQGLNKDSWREDDYGNLLHRSDYGNSSSGYGWNVSRRERPITHANHQFMLTVLLKVA